MRTNLSRIGAYGLAVLTMIVAIATPVLAGDYGGPVAAAAPEIDGASISAGLGLLSAGVMMLRARRRSK